MVQEVLVQSQDPQKESPRCFCYTWFTQQQGIWSLVLSHKKLVAAEREKGGETGRLGLSSLRDGVPTLYALREDPLSCCSPDRRGAMGEQERIRRERGSVAACRLSLLRPAGWVVAPQHVGSCFPDQRSDLHPCVGRGPLTTGPPGNPSAAFCLFFQQCSRFPGWSVRCRMSFEMNSAAGMPRHP